MTRPHYAIPAALLAAVLLSAKAPAAAPVPGAAQFALQAVQLKIEAQPMREALADLAAQTGLQLIFPSDIAPNLTAPPVNGAYTPRAALDLLLSDSGLEQDWINARTVAIRIKQSLSADNAATPQGKLLMAQADQPPPSEGEGTGGDLKKKVGSEEDDLPIRGIPEILVKGSRGRSLNADIERTRDDVRPYVVLSRETIEKSGAISVDELLRSKLTMSYVPSPNNRQTSNSDLSGNSSSIALRGLSGGETLILVDGRRATKAMVSLDSDESQSDINNIPLSAIERIEILPASASGIYGGAATGGVVNVVLRREYSGLEAVLNYQDSFEGGGSSKRVDVFSGFQLTQGGLSIQIRGSFAETDPLKLGDRDYILDYRRRRQSEQLRRAPFDYLNGFNPPLGTTANISSYVDQFDPITGSWNGLVPLTLKGGRQLQSPITSLPANYTGTAANADALVANAGLYDVGLADSQQFGGARSDLIGGSKVSSAAVTFRRTLGKNIEGFLEVSGSRNELELAKDLLSAQFVVPASVATNPFEQDVIVNAPLSSMLGNSSSARNRTDNGRVLAGMNWNIGEHWSSSAEYSYSFSKAQQSSSSTGLFLDTVYPVISSGEINLFQDPDGYTSALKAYALPPSKIDPAESRLHDVALRAAGRVWKAPAGDVKLSILLEGTKQTYGAIHRSTYLTDGSVFDSTNTGGRSKTGSVYAEVTVPLASNEQPVLGIRSAELQIAGRYDRYKQLAAFRLLQDDTRSPYTGNFSSTVPTMGFRIELLRDIIVRTSYGKGFLPPYLGQLEPAVPVEFGLGFLTDPKRGGEPLGQVTVLSGGNPELEPETSLSRSAGIIYTPYQLEGLRLSFDWTRIDKRNNIAGFSFAQRTIDSEDLYPGVVIRDASDGSGAGRITQFDIRLKNLLKSSSDSYDFSMDYAFNAGAINWRVNATATRLVHNIQQRATNAPKVDFAGTSAYPTWGANAGVELSKGGLSTQLTWRYLDAYWINDDRSINVDQGTARLSSQPYIDLTAEYRFAELPSALKSILSGMTVRMGIKNLADKNPRYVAAQAGTLSDAWGDPMGRAYTLSIVSAIGN